MGRVEPLLMASRPDHRRAINFHVYGGEKFMAQEVCQTHCLDTHEITARLLKLELEASLGLVLGSEIHR